MNGNMVENETHSEKNSIAKASAKLKYIRMLLVDYCDSGMKILWAQTSWNQTILLVVELLSIPQL